MLTLNFIWFILVGVLLAGYLILDGFDLGVGALHLFTKKEADRRVFLNSIGPVWDGNEVWLLTGGGALFAAFPMVYATVFSGFYSALIIILFALIFRAISIEFRGKVEDPQWKKVWDISFSVGSIVTILILGVAVGNIARGLPLTSDFEYYGGLIPLLNPYALIIGITSVALAMLHGALYLMMKTEGPLNKTIGVWIRKIYPAFILCYVLATGATFLFVSRMTETFQNNPVLWILPILTIVSLGLIYIFHKKRNNGYAFLSSSLLILSLMGVFGAGIFPNLVPSLSPEGSSLNIFNAASSQATLRNMLIITLLGFPLVIVYHIVVYRIFRGKVKITSDSY